MNICMYVTLMKTFTQYMSLYVLYVRMDICMCVRMCLGMLKALISIFKYACMCMHLEVCIIV